MKDMQLLTAPEAELLLAVHTHDCEDCTDQMHDFGAVTTNHDTHKPRRKTVHSMSFGGISFGADWDEDEVVAWLNNADEIRWLDRAMGHNVVAKGRDEDGKLRAYGFEVREKR